MTEPVKNCPESLLRELRVHQALDVGCGSGSFTRTLAELLGSFDEILGIDPDKDSIDEARVLTDDRRIRYRVLADRELVNAASRYDLVTMSNALHHLIQPTVSVGRLASFVRPVGFLLIREMVSDGLSDAEKNSRDIHHVKSEVDRACGRVHNPTYTREQIRRILHDGTRGWRVAASCEERSEPDSSTEMLDYVRDYLSHLTDPAEVRERELKLDEIGESIIRSGIAQPPRLVILLAPSA